MWFFAEEPWQYRVLDQLPPGIDKAQLEQARAMTPSERLQAVEELMRLGESLARAVAVKKAAR